MHDPMLMIWGIVALSIMAISAFIGGLTKDGDYLLLGFWGGLGWPIIIAGILVIAPFFLLYKLGNFFSNWLR